MKRCIDDPMVAADEQRCHRSTGAAGFGGSHRDVQRGDVAGEPAGFERSHGRGAPLAQVVDHRGGTAGAVPPQGRGLIEPIDCQLPSLGKRSRGAIMGAFSRLYSHARTTYLKFGDSCHETP